MRPLRAVAALLVVTAGIAGAMRFAYQPWRCHVELRQRLQRTEYLARIPPDAAVTPARDNLDVVSRCIPIVPYETSFYILSAENARIASMDAEAVALYKRALQFDRRPELYQQLGLAEAATGRVDEAYRSFVTAGLFDPYMILQIPFTEMRGRVENDVATRRVLPWRVSVEKK